MSTGIFETRNALFESVDIANLPVAVSNPKAAAERLTSAALSRKDQGTAIHLINAYCVALTQSDDDYRAILSGSKCNLPDGKPLSWVGRWKLRDFRQVRGPQLFENTLDHGQAQGLRHYLLGASPETLGLLQSEIARRYPDALIVGAESPPFRALSELEKTQQDQRVRQSGADIVWVGLGTPKQDFEVERIAARLPVLAVAVGAAFDFSAGSKPEAPRWMSAVGCEWLFRFGSEPRRLWKRYLVGNLVFVYAVLRGAVK